MRLWVELFKAPILAGPTSGLQRAMLYQLG